MNAFDTAPSCDLEYYCFPVLVCWSTSNILVFKVGSYENKTYKTLPIEVATRGVLWKKAVLKNFAIFTGKHLCWSLFFNKVAGFQKNFLRTQIIQNSREQLLLYPTRSITLGIAANQENVSPFVTNAPRGFLMFSGGRERVNWEQMRYKTNMIEQTFFFFFFL